jgi:hypothetical protein
MLTHTHKMKYYSAIKKDEILFSCKLMELENIMLSKVNQVQKYKDRIFSLMWKIDLNIYVCVYIYMYIYIYIYICIRIYIYTLEWDY